MKHIGYWWADHNIKLVKINNKVYALNGWNGERFLHCWQCCGEFELIPSKEIYELTPVYVQNDENSFDIVDYIVREI